MILKWLSGLHCLSKVDTEAERGEILITDPSSLAMAAGSQET